MDEIVFDVPGQPVPQPRARISTRGGFARGYVPSKHPIHVYRQAVRLMAGQATLGTLDGPFEIDLEVIVARPKSHWTKGGLAKNAPGWPVGDWDNYAKGLQDAITEAQSIWRDDSQVVAGSARKRYAERSEAPRTIVRIRRAVL